MLVNEDSFVNSKNDIEMEVLHQVPQLCIPQSNHF